jgi:ribosomal protein L10
MSKTVKELVTSQLRRELEGVEEMLLVNVVGLDAIRTTELRKSLRAKNIKLMVVKNSLARRATEGTALAPAFEGSEGTLAMLWGAVDIVTLAKEVVKLAEHKDFEKFSARGGVMGGARLAPGDIKSVSKWPTREEQLSILAGQILSPGARLNSQLLAVGGALASQIKQHAEKEGEGGAGPEAAASPAAGEVAAAAEPTSPAEPAAGGESA